MNGFFEETQVVGCRIVEGVVQAPAFLSEQRAIDDQPGHGGKLRSSSRSVVTLKFQ